MHPRGKKPVESIWLEVEKKSFVCYVHAGKSDLLPTGQAKGKEAFRLSIGIRGDISNTWLLWGNTCYIYSAVFGGTIAEKNKQTQFYSMKESPVLWG